MEDDQRNTLVHEGDALHFRFSIARSLYIAVEYVCHYMYSVCCGVWMSGCQNLCVCVSECERVNSECVSVTSVSEWALLYVYFGSA